MAGCAPSTGESNGAAGAEESQVLEANGWLGAEPEVDAAEITETLETDFLIVGAGTAGLCAAGTAAEQGMDFIICDKADLVPETREYFGIVNSKYTMEAGVEVDTFKLLNEVSRYASGKCDQSVVKVWIDESAETFEWLENIMQPTGKIIDLDLPPTHPSGGTDYYMPYLQHMWVPPYSPPMRNDVLADYIAENGHEVNFGHTLIKLKHEEGKVSGAIFETDSGYVQINAKSTLLATGGYPANPEMMKALQPAAVRCITAISYNLNDDGSGLKAGLWAGASKDPDPAPMIFDRGAVHPDVVAGYEGEGENAHLRGNIFQENIGSQPFMKVNKRGKRFANESTPYDSICFAASTQPGGVWCQVFDGNAVEDMIRFETVGCSRVVPFLQQGMTIEEYCSASLESGCMIVADTLEELADGLGFAGEDKTNFLEQVARYNELYDAQQDDDFGKEAYRLSALREAPFYGCWFGGSLLTTLDGLRINKYCQVLNEEAEVIEGLYAAGDVSGNFFSGNYPEYLVGIASGRSSVQGRYVVKHLAGEVS